MENPVTVLLIFVIFCLLLVSSWLRLLKEDERAVISRLGKFLSVKGPGLVMVLFPIEKMVKVNLQVNSCEIPPLDITTIDEIKIKTNGIVHYRVSDPAAVVRGVDDYHYTAAELSTAMMRELLPAMRIYDLLYHRPGINEELKNDLDAHTRPLGIEVTEVTIKAVEILPEMKGEVAKLVEDEEIRLKQMKLKR